MPDVAGVGRSPGFDAPAVLQLFDSAPVAMVVVRGEQHLLELGNAEFRRVVGHDRWRGRPLREALVVVDADHFVEVLDGVRVSGQPVTERETPVHLAGAGEVAGRVFYDLFYQPILGPSGEVDAILVAGTDATDRVASRMEAERTVGVLSGQSGVLERIVTGDPLPEVLEALVLMIEQRSGDGVLGSILLLDDDGVHLRHGAAPSLPAEYNAAIDGVAIGAKVGSCGTAAYRGEQVIVEDIASDPLWEDYRDLAAAAGLRACWSTPVVGGDGRLVGTFAMYYRQPRKPSSEDLALIDLLVRTAAVAIDRSRTDRQRDAALEQERAARAELERALSDLNFVLDTTTDIALSLDLNQTLQDLARRAVPVLGDVCLIDVADGDDIRRAAVAVSDSLDPRSAAELAGYPPERGGQHPAVVVIESGQPQWSRQMTPEFLEATTRDERHLEDVRRLGFESYVSVPLQARGHTFGALTLVSSGSGRRYAEREVVLAADLGRRVALSIDNISVYQSAREAERRVAVVAKAGVALTSSLDLATVIDRLGRLLVEEFAEHCEIRVRSDGHWWLRSFSAGGSTPLVQDDDLPVAVAEAVRGRTIRHLGEDLQAGFAPGLDPGSGWRSALVMPLLARNDIVGVISLAKPADHDGKQLPLDTVEVIAGRAALAIDNAILFGQERSIAEALQRSLLPDRLPAIDGIAAAARYQPAGPHSEVGGDWYDILPLPRGRVGVVIGDVMGRGISAATVMGQLRNGLRALAIRDTDPVETLSVLNQLISSGDDCPLATVLYAVLDPEQRTLTMTNAGHCPALLRRQERTHLLEHGAGPPLGAVAEPSWTQSTCDIRPGDFLVAYTDGLIETRHRPLQEGLDLLAAHPALAVTDPGALCDALLAGMKPAEDHEDDTALVAVKIEERFFTPPGP